MHTFVGTVGEQSGTLYRGDFRIEYHDLIPIGTFDGSSQGWKFVAYPQVDNKPVFTLLVTHDRYDSDRAKHEGIQHVMGRIDNNSYLVGSDYVFAWSEERGLVPLA